MEDPGAESRVAEGTSLLDREPRKAAKTTSAWGAGWTLAKTIDGAGCFAMPWAAQQAGSVGFVLCLFVGVVVGAASMHTLFGLKRRVGAESYAELTEKIVGRRAAGVVRALVGACTVGVASAYIAFVGSCVQHLAGLERRWHAVAIAAAMALPTTFLARVRDVAAAARLGVWAVVLGSALAVGCGLSHPVAPLARLTTLAGFDRCFSTVAFLFCVHFASFPVEHSMAEPRRFDRVVSVVFASTGLLNVLFGLLAASLYPRASPIVVNDIDASLPRAASQICLTVDLLASYPIVFIAAVHNLVGDDEPRGPLVLSTDRLAVFLATVAVALSESFVNIVQLVGGFGQALLALVVPPLLCALARRPLPFSSALLHAALFLLGAFLVVSSTATALAAILASHSADS